MSYLAYLIFGGVKKLPLVFFWLSWLPLFSSHIVGGEFELLHVSGYAYKLNLIYYFDEKFGDQRNKINDKIIYAKIFRVIDGKLMSSVDIPFISESLVSFTQPVCSHGEIVTSRQFYSTNIILSPDSYDDPSGYYVVWERCCRNFYVDNIISENSNGAINNPNSAGQTFYLKFPAVIKNGEQFINSSPSLFPPLNDFACPYRQYYVDFAGVDADGDSLVYSLTTPWDTQDHSPYPTIRPAPYPDIRWVSGYSIDNIIGGSPDLKISTNGLLTVTPTKQGLFVFAVKVEEFRNGIKIGETRRDYQMLVADLCEHDDPPSIVGKKLNESSFTHLNTMTVDFADTVSDGNRCIQVQVTDPQSLDPSNNFLENINLKAVALNFKSNTINQILPATVSGVLSNGSNSIFTICFPQCPFINGPYEVGIIALDDACSLPMQDTLKVIVNSQPPANSFPYFVPPKASTITINEGESTVWPFTAIDDDGDAILLSVIPEGFVMNPVGMSSHSDLQPGFASGAISWDAFCKFYDITNKTDFTIHVLADDVDKCKIIHYDTATINFKVNLPSSHPVLTIYTDGKSKNITDGSIETNPGHITLDLLGVDADAFPSDTLKLTLLDATGDISPQGYTFADATGFKSLESILSWDSDCSIFNEGVYDNQYKFRFVFSNNHCKTPTTDTAFVNVRIKDVESNDQNFIPPNVITANGDHCNDFFAIDGFEGAEECNGAARTIPFTAPLDNCVNRFEQVRIYNRWGKQVFGSTDRKFKWYPVNESPGVYFYYIKFTRAEYKSTITVVN